MGNMFSDNKEKWIRAFEDLDIERMKMILRRDKSVVNLTNNHGQSGLIYASFKGNTEITKMLIENLADLNLQDINGWTALIYESSKTDTDIFNIIAESEFNIQNGFCREEVINSLRKDYISCYKNHIERIKTLIRAGVDIYIEDKKNRTCLHHALHNNKRELVDYFIKQGLTFGVDKHKDYRNINQETHDYFEDYEGYKEYRMINEQL